MKHDNPCFDCPDNGHKGGQGCGKHSTCPKYKSFYVRQRARDREKKREEILSNYTKDAIDRVKGGTKCNLKKYRPKEGK